jgi:TPR repeat protein
MNARPRLILQLAIAAMFMVTSVAAVAADDFPGSKPDRRILKTQRKVDELFEKGDYDRAYFIYREELVPLGDKYAQYMVGYMNIVGKGVPRDYIAGSAWYRLAAERGDEKFSQARDEVWELFSDEQRIQSDKKYAEMRMDYSDAMIIANYVEKDLELISRRLQRSTLSNDLVNSQNQFDADRAQLVEEAQRRIQSRLTFLSDTIASGRPMATAEIERIREVEKRAQSAIK